VPPGLEDDDEAPPEGAELLEEPPGLDDIAPDPPVPLLDMPPVPPVLELEELPGELGALEVVEEDDDPPGTTMVSFSFVTLLVGGEPPGTTVVVSFRSQAPNASAATTIARYPLRFMSTPFSFCGWQVQTPVSKRCAVKGFYRVSR